VTSMTITLSSLALVAMSSLLHILVFKKKRICTAESLYFMLSLLQFLLSMMRITMPILCLGLHLAVVFTAAVNLTAARSNKNK